MIRQLTYETNHLAARSQPEPEDPQNFHSSHAEHL
jgi:hypothetical protein